MSVCFKGNAPVVGKDVFEDTRDLTVYYLPGTTGWGKSFGGRPTAIWKPETNGVPEKGSSR